MHVHCVWQSVYSDISRVPGDSDSKRSSRKLGDEGDIALVEDDGTLIDRNDQWLLTEAARKFYASHGDDYDFLSFFPQSRSPQSKPDTSGPDHDVYHIGIFNDIQGIGKGFRDRRDDYGSKRLQSVHFFPPVEELPKDPEALIPKNNDSTLSLIAQEFGHRWSAFVWFRDRMNGQLPSSALLGRDRSHWSFFLDTGGSPLEGNEWQERGDRFRSSGKPGGYSELDLYLMGLLGPEQVKPLNLIVSEDDSTRTASSRPEKDAEIVGYKNVITIQDIIDFEGIRSPGVDERRKPFRHAFVLLLRDGEKPREAEKLNNIRVRWEEYFKDKTGNLGEVDTRLRP